jgi:4-hydroxybenzoate polyprenyltransferase
LQAHPICVDLDGTLLRTDILLEGVLSLVSTKAIGRLPDLVTATRAQFKRRVGQFAPLEPSALPFNANLIAFLRLQRRAGRSLVLVTAADRDLARAATQHLDLFDEIIGSDGTCNLKGAAKARELVTRFGRQGFDYIGNDRSDLAVWREAHAIGIVNATTSVARKARELGKPLIEINDRPSRFGGALKAMRPHQWIKNILVFVPLLAARSLDGWGCAMLIFASLCATASSIYLANDLLDLSADRQHLRKRLRPFASGALSLQAGIVIAALLLASGIALAAMANAVMPVLLYAVLSTAYSLALKQFPLLDVFILAALYTLRIVAGGVASGHPISLWLLAFSGFTFLSLALVKRAGEFSGTAARTGDPVVARRGYRPEDRPLLVACGTASAFASSVVLALFVSTAALLQDYSTPEVLWGIVPLVLFWHCRIWLATERGLMLDDPIIYAVRDWVSWLVGLALVTLVLLGTWAPAHLLDWYNVTSGIPAR